MKRYNSHDSLRKAIKSIISEVINEEEKKEKKEKKESGSARQVKSFLNSLEKSSLARKLKTIDTPQEKLEILIKFADMIDFPKDKIAKLGSELKK